MSRLLSRFFEKTDTFVEDASCFRENRESVVAFAPEKEGQGAVCLTLIVAGNETTHGLLEGREGKPQNGFPSAAAAMKFSVDGDDDAAAGDGRHRDV